MTILRNDPVPGGLQIKKRDGGWADAPAVDDSYILNIGDLLMRWSNDRLVSTSHRVVLPPAGAQMSFQGDFQSGFLSDQAIQRDGGVPADLQ